QMIEYVLQTFGLERHQLDSRLEAAGRALDHRIGDGAHFAQLLGQDQVRLKRREPVRIQTVDTAPRVHEGSDVAVDLSAARSSLQHARGDYRLAPDAGRVIALVGHP